MSLLRTLIDGLQTKLGRDVAKEVAKQALVDAGERVKKGAEEVEGQLRGAAADYQKKREDRERRHEAKEAAAKEAEEIEAELEALRRKVDAK